MDVIDVIETSVPLFNLKDPSTVCVGLMVIMALAHLKMILQWWEHMLLQPGPLKKK